ncbi:uncharacterized protein LOC132307268 [Cornus florida]|uniref:uncharacterized protein LOC132307268 n=1 Tax=Cornus florida TaxID=4283 RepID=UPI0028A180B9|nr:uncharacterized protein LOC132307268 [Cornus florida]
MFDILFGWRKASKCKKLIRRVQCRLKLLKNKRCSIVRHIREDVAQLLKNGHEQNAINRIEQLFMDESIVTVYDLLDHFCEFIIIHLSYIRRHKDCPNDINEAVSSLIFASARCGDLPELPVIRKLFGERYGHRFATAALELLPGNLVNHQIKEKLSIKSVSDDVKYMLVDEIARSCLQSRPLAIEYSSELQQQQANNNSVHQVPDGTEGFQIHASENRETEGKIFHVDVLSKGNKFINKPFHSHQESDASGIPTVCSTGLHSFPNTSPSSMHKKEGKVEKYIQLNSPSELTISGQSTTRSSSSSISTNAVTLVLKEGNMAAESSSESSSQLPEEMIYLDDIEEFQSPTSKDVKCQDQRLFMFKSPVLHNREKFDYGSKEDYIEQSKSWNENVNSRSSTKSGRAAGKRLRRRSVSQESSSVTDVECELYYGKSFENSPNLNWKSHHCKMYQKNIQMDESQESYNAEERVEHHPCCTKRGSSFKTGKCRYDQMKSCYTGGFRSEKVNGCSLENPCYFCVSEYKEDWESPPWKQKRRTTTLEEFQTHYAKEGKMQHDNCYCCCSCKGEQHDQEMGLDFVPQKPRRNFQSVGTMSNKLTYQDHWPNKQGKEVEGGGRHIDSICSGSKLASPRTRKETQPPYFRAMTMPPERPKDGCTDNIVRSNSFPFEQPSPHVHPKLPDYDELAAKFRALKKANSQNKHL